jgi:hypothetical protein
LGHQNAIISQELRQFGNVFTAMGASNGLTVGFFAIEAKFALAF